MRTNTIRVLLLLAAALSATGCGTAISEATGVVLGGRGSYMAITPMAADKATKTLGSYTNFELGAIGDGIGGKMPAELIPHLETAFTKEVRGSHLPDDSAGRTLLIRGTVIHYESTSTVGYVLGPLEEVICRTELVDKATGQVLGVANCVGRTKAASSSGVKEKAVGLAKAFVKWIEYRFPDDKKIK